MCKSSHSQSLKDPSLQLHVRTISVKISFEKHLPRTLKSQNAWRGTHETTTSIIIATVNRALRPVTKKRKRRVLRSTLSSSRSRNTATDALRKNRPIKFSSRAMVNHSRLFEICVSFKYRICRGKPFRFSKVMQADPKIPHICVFKVSKLIQDCGFSKIRTVGITMRASSQPKFRFRYPLT